MKTKMSDDLRDYCQKIITKHKIPGFSIGLNEGGQPLWYEGFGYRNVAEQLPVSADTVFGIGSITKSFTCIAIMQLQEAGKLSVHDPVIKFLPEFKTPDEQKTKNMTLHHLMTNSSGIPPLPTLFNGLKDSMLKEPVVAETEEEIEKDKKMRELLKGLTPVVTKEELIDFINQEDYEFLGELGEQFSYLNDGFALLGVVIERVSGISYEQYIKEHILDPVGMTNSVFHLYELKNHDDCSTLYAFIKRDGEKVVYESDSPWDSPSMRSAGFLKSTVNDMLKYAEIFRNHGKVGDNQIISPESVEAMTTPHVRSMEGRYYGYGLMITPDFFGHKLVEHGGGIKGVSAQLSILPEVGLTGVALANLASVPSQRLLNSAFNDYLGKSVTEHHVKVEEVEVDPALLEDYVGQYRSGERTQINIVVKDDQLKVITEDNDILPLTPLGEDAFSVLLMEEKMIIHFIRNEANEVIRVLFGFRQLHKIEEENESE